jgi:small conductance mechanosensitive channel
MDLDAIVKQATQIAIEMVPKVAGAIVLWLAGRWLIRLALGGVGRALSRQGVDPTVARYAQTSLGVVLNVALIVALLGFFGVETTTFAALVAAGGVAIGVAWGGLLANFAAGAFLIVLRPFKVGDMVSAGGVTGQVEAIGLFGTTINTPDNVLTIVGNNKIFSDTIQNYSANPYRRVDLVATINNHQAIQLLRTRIGRIPNVLASPEPQVDVLQFTPAGPVLCVRPFCSPEHYWQVYFDANRAIREAFADAGFPAPVPPVSIQAPLN